jgi:hypothetical protein
MGGPKDLETHVFRVLLDPRPDPARWRRWLGKIHKKKHSISQTPIPNEY